MDRMYVHQYVGFFQAAEKQHKDAERAARRRR